jgi:hypothetical protein
MKQVELPFTYLKSRCFEVCFECFFVLCQQCQTIFLSTYTVIIVQVKNRFASKENVNVNSSVETHNEK